MVCLHLLQVQTTASRGRHSKREAAKKEEAKVEEPVEHNHSSYEILTITPSPYRDPGGDVNQN
jgi:hypothetical protein